jgi:hypothetical protein
MEHKEKSSQLRFSSESLTPSYKIYADNKFAGEDEIDLIQKKIDKTEKEIQNGEIVNLQLLDLIVELKDLIRRILKNY